MPVLDDAPLGLKSADGSMNIIPMSVKLTGDVAEVLNIRLLTIYFFRFQMKSIPHYKMSALFTHCLALKNEPVLVIGLAWGSFSCLSAQQIVEWPGPSRCWRNTKADNDRHQGGMETLGTTMWVTKRVLFQSFTGKDTPLTFENYRDGISQRAVCERGDGEDYTDLVESHVSIAEDKSLQIREGGCCIHCDTSKYFY